ncbi:MAG: phosphoribosylanthranilate isomerase [Dehalococcoidia bacterium]|nr:phosphoribosylanthranilate isomerase [Dehalococcoidia bacterium]
MTRVKICGCTSVEDAVAAAEAGADFVGVVFAPSRRRVSVETARRISEALGGAVEGSAGQVLQAGVVDPITRFQRSAAALERLLSNKRPLLVAVFQDQPMEEVNALSARAGADLVQLSGSEPWEWCSLAELPVIKALDEKVIDAEDPFAAMFNAQGVALCSLDCSHGRGRRGDWGLAAAISRRMPLVLAGGLTPLNVAEAVSFVRPWCVDVSSGVETNGRKDAAKMREFVAAAKGVAVT